MRFRATHPLLAAATALALLPGMVAPAHALTSSLSSIPLTIPVPGLEKIILVDIPGHGPYLISQEVQGGGLDLAAASQEDLLTAAVFSADYESNAAAREAALQALSPERRTLVTAALQALHSDITPASAAPAGAPIAVLGNGLNTDGSVHPNLAHRLEAARELAAAHPTAPIVVSGGPTPDGHVEAHAMRDWLTSQGLPDGRIIVEDRANSTVTNARYSRQLLPGATSVIVVTSENHLRRAVVDFTLAFGADATVAGVGTPTDPPEGMPSSMWTYRDAVNWFLGQ
ncbi:YdcF family protein [Corynebacterium sp.]|uniref:YdcF family protein n=1 Tax=Corynebacterium sp. TaxID=1720 RepID=UPI00198E60CA|nr:YdcF family protein [Corynebacterium sp.]HHU67363.1 YdcF family protein [Corynebacterium sp.]HZK32754.1 YdcF family protein [Corynebacterium sp.]